jgi:hypothetical protein
MQSFDERQVAPSPPGPVQLPVVVPLGTAQTRPSWHCRRFWQLAPAPPRAVQVAVVPPKLQKSLDAHLDPAIMQLPPVAT